MYPDAAPVLAKVEESQPAPASAAAPTATTEPVKKADPVAEKRETKPAVVTQEPQKTTEALAKTSISAATSSSSAPATTEKKSEIADSTDLITEEEDCMYEGEGCRAYFASFFLVFFSYRPESNTSHFSDDFLRFDGCLSEKFLAKEAAVDEDPREHLNVVFIGHVDAGKSTCSGQLLFMTGMVNERLIEKYSKEASDKKHASWFLAYIMDALEEERAKGKTVEVGRAHFNTDKKRYTILDAPGHKNYVPNMIMGVTQADVGILIISARKGEFEAGFEKSGQTREHALLARTLGVKTLLVAINKMDDPTVNWEKKRFDEIVEKLNLFLAATGFNPKKDLIYLPIAGLAGSNIKGKLTSDVCSWYSGESLIGTLDALPPIPRNEAAPLRIPILDKFKDMGVIAMGKVEQGAINRGQSYTIMPGNLTCEVIKIENDEKSLKRARAGENVNVTVKGIDEGAFHRGYVLCDSLAPAKVATEFVAQLMLMDLPSEKVLFTASSTAVLHVHTAVCDVEVVMLLAELDKKTGQIVKKLPKFVKSRSVIQVHLRVPLPICLEAFKDFPQLGRFILRDEALTIAFGKVLRLGPPLKKKGEN